MSKLQVNTYALQSSLSFKQRLLITKTVKSHCKKHVLNVADILNVESIECWCFHLGKYCQLDRSIKGYMCKNCLLTADDLVFTKGMV